MTFRSLILLAVTLFAGTATAKPVLLTAPLQVVGVLRCSIANVSHTRTVTVELAMYGNQGNVIDGPNTFELLPHQSISSTLPMLTSVLAYCEVTVLKGGRRNVRTSLEGIDVDGASIGYVSGNRGAVGRIATRHFDRAQGRASDRRSPSIPSIIASLMTEFTIHAGTEPPISVWLT